MYSRCTYWLYSEDFCTLSLETSSIPSWRCGKVADNADASQGNRPMTVTPLTKATECSRVDISDLAIYNQWKWSISHCKISFALGVEKGGAFAVFHQHELKMKINSKNPFSDFPKQFWTNCCQGSPTKKHQSETITYQNLCKNKVFSATSMDKWLIKTWNVYVLW